MNTFRIIWTTLACILCTVVMAVIIQEHVNHELFELRLQQEHNQLVLLEALNELHGDLAEAKRDREELEAMLQLSLSGGP